MIIVCVNCNKKFEVNSSLIPEKGRSIQCGACNHIWFYTKKIEIPTNTEVSKQAKVRDDFYEINDKNTEPASIIKKDTDDKEFSEKKVINKKSNFSLSKIFSYLIVFIISFIALILVLETFKSYVSNIFPGLEILLYNLFETVKDIYLFSKNLIN